MPKLYVSFWHICLENLPEGTLRRSRITHDAAAHYIAQARKENALICVSEDDLAAPYRKRERGNHEALCKVLREKFGIDVALKDFFAKSEDDEGALYFINCLNFARVEKNSALLIVTCAYSMADKKHREDGESPLMFEVEPSSVVFDIIEAVI